MNIAICTICRLEELYIREFIDFYLKAGVTHIYLYDNNDIEYKPTLLEIVSDYSDVTVIDYRSDYAYGYAVLHAYTDCYETYGKEYDWIGFLDCDEYLYENDRPITKKKLIKLLLIDADILHINWQILNDNNQLYYEPKPLMERFTTPVERNHLDNFHVKSFVKTGLNITFLTPHTPYVDKDEFYTVKDIDGVTIKNTIKTKQVKHRICFRHPRTKTIQEYCENKISKLTMSGYSKVSFDDKFFFSINKYSKEKEDLYLKYLNQYGYIDFNNDIEETNCADKNITVITALFDNYDKLREVINPCDNIKCICITDDPTLTSNTWEIIQAPQYIMDMQPIARYKYIKFHPWEFTDDQFIHYIDATIEINVKHTLLLYKKIITKELSLFYHPLRNNVLDELFTWVTKRNYESGPEVLRDLYDESNKYSLYFLCSFMLIPTENVKALFDELWKYMLKYGVNGDVSRSDQVLFTYVFNKLEHTLNYTIINPYLLNSTFMLRYEHSSKKWTNKFKPLFLKDKKLIKPLKYTPHISQTHNNIIISNDCSGAYFYSELLTTQYNHPFVWNKQRSKDFINTVKKLKTVDWTKFSISRGQGSTREVALYMVVTSNDITINYVHKQYDENDNSYEIRVDRLIHALQEPNNIIIIVNENGKCSDIFDEISSICTENNYKLIYCSDKIEEDSLENNILKIKCKYRPSELCSYICDNYDYVEWLEL